MKFIIAGKETNSCGVLIALDNNFEYEIKRTVFSDTGRFIIVDIEIPQVVRFLLINIYVPNEDSPKFFEDLFNTIEEMDIRNTIFTGDWNVVNDFNQDTLNYTKLNNPKSHNVINHFKQKLDLIDIWRKTHPDINQFTWKQFFYKKNG